MFGTKDHVATDATACASSMKVLMDVQTLMRFYGFDRVVVLAVEDQVTNMTLDFFGESQASLAWKDEKEGMKPLAFDSVNGGFHVGQGACLAVFENEATVKRRGITPKARLLGAYTASEVCSNAIGQSDNGEGFAKAAKGALSMAELSPECIAVIKTHGTGTKSNNRAEKCAINGLFPDFVATSYKQVIGHTMGVSGLLETCMLIDNMNSGFVPAIPNRTQEDDVFLSHDIEAPKGAILSLAAGMGNVYSAAVLTTEL
jgi:3-oxoacyl-(acyl-carrier-protein) synthase